MKLQNINLIIYSLLWMCFMFFTVRVTEGKLGLASPHMPKKVIQKVEQVSNISKNKNFATLKESREVKNH